jgi:DNA polymerase I-like protein with 3'-5' exonuclease and polymerase domains
MDIFKPQSSWKPPTELPDLRRRVIVAIDSETRDRGLEANRGPGWPFGRDFCRLCGISWAAEGSVGYAPVGHPDTENFPLENVLRWLDDLFKSGTRIVMHNGPYDVGVFGTYGVVPPANLEDTLAAAVMLDEDQPLYPGNSRAYSLDNCCARYGIEGKDTDLLRQAVRAYGGNPNKPAGDLWRVPARYAGPYAEQDGVATLELWQHQEPQLRAQEVWDAYRTEMELIPMVVAMRRRGIRIDAGMVDRTRTEFLGRRDALLKRISEQAGSRRLMTIGDVRSPQFLEKLFTQEGIPFPRTEKTKQGSFSADWMEKYDHWLPQALVDIIRYEDAAQKFLANYLTGYAHRGRIHAEVHQFRSDDGGTKSHRFSYSEPPLQQMPSPDKDPTDALKKVITERATGTLIRRCFLPEQGEAWGSVDFSSQEPRLVVHFASLCKCPGADEAVRQYLENPRLDYHQMTADLTGLPRAKAKILNLAMLYGYGRASMAAHLGVGLAEADELARQYHERLPFIKPFEERCKTTATNRGYIRLIDGARIRYNMWEGPYLSAEERLEAHKLGHVTTYCSREEAQRRQEDPAHPWAGRVLRRADTRKGLNNLIQGSAARQTKIAMRNMWRAGILPLLQLHDEVAVSVRSKQELEQVAQFMVEATPLRVPTVVDAEVGDNWGNAKMSWDKYEQNRQAQAAA